MIRRVSKYTMGIIIAIAFSLFVLGLMIMSIIYLVAYMGSLR
jgi:hypothetical protein